MAYFYWYVYLVLLIMVERLLYTLSLPNSILKHAKYLL